MPRPPPKKASKLLRREAAAEEAKKRPHVNIFDLMSASDCRNYARLKKYFKSKGKIADEAVFFDIFLHTKRSVGSLRGKKVLMISADPTFASFLRAVEGARVTNYEVLVQWIEDRLGQGNFRLIMANRVFEPDAFERFMSERVEREAEKAIQRKSFQRYLAREHPRHIPAAILGRRDSQAREAQRFENKDILRQLAGELAKGGYFILTGSSSKPIFKSQEATRAGFKIIKMNEPCLLDSHWRVTILQKK